MTIKNIAIALAVIAVLLLAGKIQSAAAQTTSSSPTVEDLQKQIQLMLNQMASLQKEITSLKSGTAAPTAPTAIPPTAVSTPLSGVEIDESEITEETEAEFIPPPALARSLTRGSRGEDVRQLQEFLAQDPAIYPEGIATGYYGAGTEAAVRRWQAKNGVPSVGIVGRQTISKFKELYSGTSVGSEQTRLGTSETGPTTRTKTTTACPVYGYMPVCKEGQSSYDQKGCQVCQSKTIKESIKKEVCPALPTVDSCLAGEERVVTYKSEQCGVFYACKPRETVRTSNTVATLKKTSSIQTDSRYTLILNDPDGIQRFAVSNAKGAEVQSGYPACRKDWTTPTFIIESAEFPPKLTLYDCGSPSLQYTATLNTPVVVQQVENLSFPYTFTNGKIVNSFNEASSYCYANGPGTGQGVAAECETKFGIVYYQTVPNTTVGSSGRAAYSSDSFASCMTKYGFGAESKQIKSWAQLPDPIPWSQLSSGAQNSVTVCEKEYYGQGTVETGAAMCSDGKDNDGDGFIDSADSSCGAGYTAAPPSGQKEQIWNSLGLKSWIKTDADSSRITQLKQSCASTPSNSNIWMPNAGVSTSIDFGMPDAAKCQRAASCIAGQYFDGASCVAGIQTNMQTTTSTSSNWVQKTWTFRDGQTATSYILNRTDAEYANYLAPIQAQCLTINKSQFGWKPNAGSDAASNWQNFGMPDCSGTATTQTITTSTNSCNSALISLLGTGCHYMYNNSAGNQIFCDGPMTKSAKQGDTAAMAGCSSSSITSTTSTGGGTYAGDANSCPGFAYSRWDYSSPSRRYCQLNTEARCDYNYPSYLTNGANYTAANCPATTSSTGSDTSTWCSPLGSGWTVYGSYCLNSSRTQYTPLNSPNFSSVQYCAGTDLPVTGCTPPGGSTTTTASTGSCSQYGSGWHVMGDNNCYDTSMTNYRTANGTLYSCSATPSSGCSSGTAMTGSTSSSCGSGYYWNGSTCVSSSTATGSSCTSGQYWNGTACVTSTTSSNCSTPSNCFDSSVCASSGWSWYNGGCWSSPQSSTSTGTSCPSGQYWSGSSCVTSTTSGSSTTCASGQYWNGSSCIASTSSGSTTTCPSGNYWNGTACVPSTTPSASIYDQMRNQLKSMEIILRGLLNK